MAAEILAQIQSLSERPGNQPGVLADAFFGAGAVSIAAKTLGWEVRANDMSPISEALAEALIVNDSWTLGEPNMQRALLHDPGEIPSDRELSLPANCRNVLARMAGYERELPEGPARWLTRAWIAKTAIGMATWGVPTMAAGRRTWDELTPGQAQQLKRTGKPIEFALKAGRSINPGVFQNGRENTFNRGDAVEFVKGLEGVDVLYLDPPYPNTMAYEQVYVGVNRLLEPDASDKPSEWSAADGWKLLGKVFAAADAIPTIVISMGTNADPERIVEMLTATGREASHRTLDLKHMTALKSEHGEGGDELLIVGKK